MVAFYPAFVWHSTYEMGSMVPALSRLRVKYGIEGSMMLDVFLAGSAHSNIVFNIAGHPRQTVRARSDFIRRSWTLGPL